MVKKIYNNQTILSYFISLNLIFFLFFLFNPLNLLITNISNNLFNVFFLQLLNYLFLLLIVNFIYYIIYKKKLISFIKFSAFCSIYLSCLSIIYNYLYPKPSIFFDDSPSSKSLYLIDNELFIIFGDFLIISASFIILYKFFFNKKAKKNIFKIIWVYVFLFLFTLLNFFNSYQNNKGEYHHNFILNSQKKNLIKFSKNENKILIILDGLSQNILKKIIKQNNDVKSDLSDFVIFENSITTHPGTWGSLLEILYGYRGLFHPKHINIKKNEQIKLVNDKFFKSNSFNKYIIDRNENLIFNLARSFTTSIYLSLPRYVSSFFFDFINLKTFDNFYNNFSKINILNYFYLKLHDYKIDLMDSYSMLNNLNNNIVLDENLNFSFTQIYSIFPHPPVHFDQNCQYFGLRENNLESYYDMSLCSLKSIINFFDKLKELKIYDETEIIITSDHGWPKYKKETKQDYLLNDLYKKKNYQSFQSRFSSYLLETTFLYKKSKSDQNIKINQLLKFETLPVQLSMNILCDNAKNFKCPIEELKNINYKDEIEIFILNYKKFKKGINSVHNHAIVKDDYKNIDNWKIIK